MELTKERIEKIVEQEDESVRNFKNGEDGAINYLVGCVMEETGGRASPPEAQDAIEECIDTVGDNQ